MQLKPGFLSRSYGGAAAGPHLVDARQDSARLVGDEALLLADHGPVAVARDRAAGALLLLENGADFLIMDDGFQSARIHMDYALLVVDSRQPVEDLTCNRERLVGRQRAAGRHQGCQRLTVDELHDEEELAGIFAGVVHGDEVRMVEAGG